MKKITQSSLAKILSCIALYKEQNFPDDDLQKAVEDLNSYIITSLDIPVPLNKESDVVLTDESDLKIASIVIIEKIKVLLKALENASDTAIDKEKIRAFLELFSS